MSMRAHPPGEAPLGQVDPSVKPVGAGELVEPLEDLTEKVEDTFEDEQVHSTGGTSGLAFSR